MSLPAACACAVRFPTGKNGCSVSDGGECFADDGEVLVLLLLLWARDEGSGVRGGRDAGVLPALPLPFRVVAAVELGLDRLRVPADVLASGVDGGGVAVRVLLRGLRRITGPAFGLPGGGDGW